MSRRTEKVAQPVPEPSGPFLTDSKAMARYVFQRFTNRELGATGALLLDKDGAPIGILILESRLDTGLSTLEVSAVGGHLQIVPFLFRPASDPMVTDEESAMFCGLLESAAGGAISSDCLYVWSTGKYLSRSRAGKVGCIDDEPKGEA